jgi:hypothetical protein
VLVEVLNGLVGSKVRLAGRENATDVHGLVSLAQSNQLPAESLKTVGSRYKLTTVSTFFSVSVSSMEGHRLFPRAISVGKFHVPNRQVLRRSKNIQ